VKRRLPFVRDDGGRHAARFIPSGDVGDCVCRSIAIASGRPYTEIWEALALGNATQRRSKRTHPAHHGVRSASMGIYVKRKWLKDYMRSLGFKWVPAIKVGQRDRMYLHDLPTGRLVVEIHRHNVAVIDRVIHDTYDTPQKRIVYGYWVYGGPAPIEPAKVPRKDVPVETPPRARWVWWAWALLALCLIAQFVLIAEGH
jgi:hypothetical protein